METRAQLEGTGQTGTGILALSLTFSFMRFQLPGVAFDPFLPSFFPSLLPSSFFCFLFSLLLTSFFPPLFFTYVLFSASLCPVFYLHLLSSSMLPS